jgi:hypothetical protein
MGVICCEDIIKRKNTKYNDSIIFEDFLADKESNKYDMILNFFSFEQLNIDKLTAFFTIKGKEKYDESLNNYNIVIGVLGIKNRGKSYLLRRIMKNKDYTPPSGFLITTYGISCNFPVHEAKGAHFITLDTAGKDSPLLQNELFKNKDIKAIGKDQKFTEIFLSDFIIQEANVLIAVVEQLSFEEQEMLKTLIERLKQKDISGIQRRKLIVIHNLMNITKVEDIKKFVNEVLFNSLTFSLEPQSMGKNDEVDDSDKYFYVQKLDIEENNSSVEYKLDIIHLIMGNDEEDAIKEEFNEPALRFIRDHIIVNTSRKFDVVKAFKDFIIKKSNKYFTEEKLPIFVEKPLTKKVYKNKEKTADEERILIPIKSDKRVHLKDFNIQYDGKENFFNKIDPRYSSMLIKKDEKYYIEIIFEVYGKVKNLKSKTTFPESEDNQYIILIKGETEDINKIEKETTFGNLEYAEFNFQVKIKKYLPTKNEKKEIEIEMPEDEIEKPIKYKENNKGNYQILIEVKLYED